MSHTDDTGRMTELMPIGDFARATHLSIKTLRYYHEAGLLEPARIDPETGYRRYRVDQIPTAQVIRRFRDLGMPLGEIRGVLDAPDPTARDALIAGHLRRLEADLERTRSAITTLRDLLEHPDTQWPVERRHVPGLLVAAITEHVATAEIGGWLQGALGELYSTVAAQGQPTGGVAGGVYADGLFEADEGQATIYLPVTAPVTAGGRVHTTRLPATDLAVVSHDGPEAGIDLAYGALAAYVTRHAISVAGPIREMYPVNRHHTGDPTHWRTEIGWPIFPTHLSAARDV